MIFHQKKRLMSSHARSSALPSSTVLVGIKTYGYMVIMADDGLGVLMGSCPCAEGV